MLYATSRELAKAFGIKVSRWKRWSREFLPPDPLGGYQSGYCRQYNFRDIFLVALAGHLVSDFKLAIAEARQILADIQPWLQDTGFMDLTPNHHLLAPEAPGYHLSIVTRLEGVGRPVAPGCFAYQVMAFGPEKREGTGPQVVWKTGDSRAGLQTIRTVQLTNLYTWCRKALAGLGPKQG